MAVSASSMKVDVDENPLKQAYLEKCAVLQDTLRASTQAADLGLEKTASNLFRHRQVAQSRIDVKHFQTVIAVDTERMLAEIEGMAPYDVIVNETLRSGCMPTVVPELKSITIGGALSGIGIESSSFRYGLVHETIEEFDVLLSDGEIVTCRADNAYSDLFFAFPNSYGTLGYALRVVVKLVETKPYVRLSHQHFYRPEVFFERLKDLCEQNHASGIYDFVEAVSFGPHDLIMTTGRFVAQVPYTHDYTHMRIYYQSLMNRTTDYLTAKDYIWRWDTDWFWCSKVFGLQQKFLRFIAGKWCLNSRFYWKVMRLAHRNRVIKWIVEYFSGPTESIIQDVVIPIENAATFFNFFNEDIGIKPFWMCPVIAFDNDTRYPMFNLKPNQLYINFGFWATIPTREAEGHYNRLIEQKVVALEGMKSLYSSAYYTEEEFWAIYDKRYYTALKEKYDASGRFRSLYQKCTERN